MRLPLACVLTFVLAACSAQAPLAGEESDSGTGDLGGKDAGTPETQETPDGSIPEIPEMPKPPPPPANGLRGEYFSDYVTPAVTRVDPNIDFDWPQMSPEPGTGVGTDWFSARWTGKISARFSELYTFEVTSDDGVRVWINGQLVVQNWTGHFPTANRGTIMLQADQPVDIRVDYFELDLGATLKLSWSSPSQPLEVVPTERLSPPATPIAGLRSPRPDYTNPVVPFDCPDPGVVEAEGAYYAVCTGGSFPIRKSLDLVRWKDTGVQLMPGGLAPWSGNGGRNWAPELHKIGSTYVAYYTSANKSNVLCIGAASAPSILGPWTHTQQPLVDGFANGVIDATFFEDTDGKRYLYYKPDENSVGRPTPILVRQLSDDGLSFAPGSTAKQVLVNNPATWEGGVIEAPWVIKHANEYFLIYSGNVYNQNYRTGVARSTSPLGPFTKRPDPILANNATFVGPGHGSVVKSNDQLFFVYHSWRANLVGGRFILLDKITWDAAGWPAIGNGTPSVGALPAP